MEASVLAKKVKRKQKKHKEAHLHSKDADAVDTAAVEKGILPAQSSATSYTAQKELADDEKITATIQSPTADADKLEYTPLMPFEYFSSATAWFIITNVHL